MFHVATSAAEGYSNSALPYTGGDPIGLVVVGVCLLLIAATLFATLRRRDLQG